MKLKVFAAVVFAALIVAVVVWIAGGNQPINAGYPVPNAYDTLVIAADSMKPVPMDYDTSKDVDALNEYLDSNAQTFQLVQRALGQEYLVPLDSFATMGDVVDNANHTRAIARLMFVRARVAEMEGRSEDAADILTDAIVLADRSANGGLLVHQMIAVASQRQAIEALTQLAPKLPPDQSKQLLARLEAEVAGEPSVDDQVQASLDRERAMVMREYGRAFGTWMLWQASGLDDPTGHVREALQDLRKDRKRLFEMLATPNGANAAPAGFFNVSGQTPPAMAPFSPKQARR